MPNWVYNGLTIEGKTESVTKLVEQMNQPFHLVHDNWDMNTQAMVKKDTLYPNPVFAFWNIIKPTDLEAYTGPQPKFDINKPVTFGSDHWYDWNVRNWGVKWDVAKSSEDGDYHNTYMEGPVQNGENLAVYYNFDTPWGIADQALTNLSSQYPDLLFTLIFEEETGWGGELEILRGKIISQSEYQSKCVECDAYDTVEYCEDCADNVCSDCGYGRGNDCETHKEKADA